jgi:hypothetical protein
LQAQASHHQIWPTLAALHDLLPGQATGSVVTSGPLPFDAAIVLSQVQAQRGEHDIAQELLLRSASSYSDSQRAGLDRELAQHALNRGDVSEALSLLSRFVLDAPENEALRSLTATVDTDNALRLREQEANAILP